MTQILVSSVLILLSINDGSRSQECALGYDYGFNTFPATYRTINPDTNELVWCGVGEEAVDMMGGISQERINTIVSDILKEYPPRGN